MNQLKSTSQAAATLGLKEQTLRIWRLKGIGPKYVRFGGPKGRVGYREEDIEEWLRANTFQSTSEETVKQG